MLMSNRDDGLRSLRCCKRRSVVSNLRGFGQKWVSSRLRIAIIHPEPIRGSPSAAYSAQAVSSDLALAAAAGLSIQGHSVSLYTSGYRQKDIPEYFWETTGDVKACIPRIARLALFPPGTACSRMGTFLVSVIISARVLFDCLIYFIVNFVWSILPAVVQRARGGPFAYRPSTARVLDIVISFGDNLLPHLFLSCATGEIVHFPMGMSLDEIEPKNAWMKRILNLARCSHVVGSTDSESLQWTSIANTSKKFIKVSTLYAPVISFPISPRTSSMISGSRPFFVSLAWYADFQEVLIAIESFSVFLSNLEDLREGCTGSGSVSNLPFLIVAGVSENNKALAVQEINRCDLVEGGQVVLLANRDCPSDTISEILDKCIAVIHTPGEINQVRVPCAAMLAGKPVITTVSFSQAEPVRHEATGFIVKTRSAQVIAQTIDSVFSISLNRPSELTRMGLRARQRVLTEFSVEMFGSRLDDALSAVRD